MNCMKCGREVEDGQVFCAECLAVMAKYPVKPGIAIQIPQRKTTPAQKKAYVKRRQPPKPEEKIRSVKKWLRSIMLLWFITLILLAATIYPTVEYFMGKAFPIRGQNYTTIIDAETTKP